MSDWYEAHVLYYGWSRRMLGQPRGGHLGFPAELWTDQPDHPAAAWFRDRRGDVSDMELRFNLTRTLIRDVLDAGGGVELQTRRVLAALDEAEQSHLARVADDPSRGWQPNIEQQHTLVPPSLAWDYPSLLTWLRTLEERMQRGAWSAGDKVSLGLIPAVGEAQLRSDLEEAFERFVQRVGDERTLTNYALHAAQVPGPSTPAAEVQEDNSVLFRIPDAPEKAVFVFDQFTYDEARDLRSFATEALSATDELVTAVLDAFGRAQERVMDARDAAGQG